MLFDDHMHTALSTDNVSRGQDMCRAALEKGIGSLCFTEHLDIGHPSAGGHKLDMVAYDVQIRALRAQFPRLEIRMGVELGYMPGTVAESAKHIAAYPIDYVLISQHTVYGEDPCFAPFYRGREKRAAYVDYLKELLESVAQDVYTGYNAVAHIGFMAKFAPYASPELAYRDFSDYIDEILKAIISRQKALEVNTSGLAYGGRTLPDADALARYRELGGELVTIGSDAHQPQNVGRGLDIAVAQLKAAGFRYVFRYKQMQPYAVPLDALAYDKSRL